MKIFFKTGLLAAILVTLVNISRASHIMGGDFSYTYVGGGKYYVQLTLYRDCYGVAVPSTVTLNATSASCGTKYNSSYTLNQVGSKKEVTPVSPNCTYSSTCKGGTDPGVEQYKYGDTITLPGHCKDWVLTVTPAGARNAAITNLNATGKNMTIVCTINNSIGITASSPVFSSIPTPYLCPGTSEIYSQGAYDPDGDSLSFAAIAPHNTSATDSISYVSPYSSKYPLSVVSGTSFCTDAQTGQLNFTPSKVQVTVIAIEVTKWRKISGTWTKIGSVERDMQISVLSGSLCKGNKPPLMHSPFGVSGGTVSAVSKGCSKDSQYTFHVCENTELQFSLPCIDSVSAQLLTVTTNGASAIPGASVTITSSGTGNNKKNVNFKWKPVHGNAGTYLFTTSLEDTACPLKGLSSYVTKIVVVPKTWAGNDTSICIGTSATLEAIYGDTFYWHSSTDTTTVMGASITVTPTTTTTYYVKSNYTTCDNHDTVVVYVVQKIKLINTSLTICAGKLTNLSANSNPTGTKYLWSPGGGTSPSVNVAPTTTTTYVLSIKNALGCTYNDTAVINANPLPVITINATKNNICKGGTDTLTSSGGITYKWNPGGASGNTLIVTPADTTTYTSIVTTTKGCVDSSKIRINIKHLPTITTNPNYAFICPGSKDIMIASGGVSYLWTPGNYTNDTVSVTPTTTIIYTVTGLGANGCYNQATVKFDTKPVPSLTFKDKPAICIGKKDTIKVRGGKSYVWLPGNKSDSNFIVTPTVTTRYTVTAAASNGCTDSGSVLISVNPLPKLSLSVATNPVCQFATDTLKAFGAKKYVWNTTAKDTTNTLFFSTAASKRYVVTGTDTNGCVDTVGILITVKSLPVISVVSGRGAICVGAQDTLRAAGGVSYVWQPGALTGSTVIVSPSVTTTYTIYGTGPNSCVNTSTDAIIVNQLPGIKITASVSAICVGKAATLTASGANSYKWSPGNAATNTYNVSPTATTRYTATGTDSKGCVDTASFNLIVNPLPNIKAASKYGTICLNNYDTLTASGGSSYVWSPGNKTTNPLPVSPTSSCFYNVTGTDANGCTDTASVYIKVKPSPNISLLSGHPSICYGKNDTLQAQGAVTYNWQPGNLTGARVIVSPTVTTTYTVYGTGANGCTNSLNIVITVNSLPTLTITPASTAICIGNSSTFMAGGAKNYVWTPGGQTTASITVSPSITTRYVVQGTDTRGCVDTVGIKVTVNPLPNIIATGKTPSICNGKTDSIMATGGITYQWMPGNKRGTSIAVSPSSTTVYKVKGMDANGCIDSASYIVTVFPLPVVLIKPSHTAICFNSSDTLTGSGAKTYLWQPGSYTSNTIVVTPSAQTIYTLTGTDSNNCLNSAFDTIAIKSLPIITISSSASTVCKGNYSILTAAGASTYIWKPGLLTGSTVSVKPSTTTSYVVIGTGSNGCVDSSSLNVKVTVFPLPVVTVKAAKDTICANYSDTLTAAGATKYLWTGALMGSKLAVSPSITTRYNVKGTDTNGCFDTTSILLLVKPIPSITAAATHSAICIGKFDTLSASGGINYTWVPGNLSGAAVQVNPTVTTTYTVVGTGANNCTNNFLVSVTVNTLPNITANAVPSVLCKGSSSVLKSSNGVSYSWIPGNFNGNNVSITPKTTTRYKVTGIDANGCVDTSGILVKVNPLPVIVLKATPSTICSGDSSVLNASGGKTYIWQPGTLNGAKVTIHPTLTTNFKISVTDSNNCVDTSIVKITVNPLPAITDSAYHAAICIFKKDTLTASGGLTYTWQPGNFTGKIIAVSPATTTTYTVTGKDKNNCINTNTVIVKINPLPTLKISTASSIICFRDSTKLTVTGAVSYRWSPTSMTGPMVSVKPIRSTKYTVSGTDANGCIDTTSIKILVNPLPKIAVKATPGIICKGDTSVLRVRGGRTYLWQPGGFIDSIKTVKPISSQRYKVIATDSNLCHDTASIYVKVDSLPLVNVTADSTFICLFKSENLKAAGTCVSYVWTPGNLTGATISVSPAATTRYHVVGTDGNSCRDTSSILVIVKPLPCISTSVTQPVICLRDSTTLAATGGKSYLWQPGNVTLNPYTLYPTTTQRYKVTGKDANYCTDTASIVVVVNPLPVISTLAKPAKICVNDSTIITVSGGKTYEWQPGSFTDSMRTVKPAVTTRYSVTVTDGKGCHDTSGVNVMVDTLPVFYPLTNHTAICFNDSVILRVIKPGISYTWQPGNAKTSLVVEKPTVTTIYTVIGVDGNNCKTTEMLAVTVYSLPLVKAVVNPPVICIYDSARLLATGATSYFWLPGSFSDSAHTIAPLASTRFGVVGTDAHNCRDTASVWIKVNPLPVVKVTGTNDNFCGGDTATLFSKGAKSYYWLPGSDTGRKFVFRPFVTTTYTVTGTDTNNCRDTAQITLHVKPLPNLIAIADPAKICPGDLSTLSAKGAVAYVWNPVYNTSNGLSIRPLVTTTYYVSGTGTNGCIKIDTLIVTVDQPPLLHAHATHHLACTNVPDTLIAGGAVRYTWEPGKYHTDTVILNLPVTATFTVTGTDTFGCTGTDTASINVAYKPSHGTHYDTSIYKDTKIKLFTSNPHSNYFRWSPDTFLSDTAARNPICQPLKPERYIVIYHDKHGCYVQDTFIVRLKKDCLGIFVPNAFSPNGDGINDELKLIATHGETLELFRIYSRWGKKVFETTDITQTWDGYFGGQLEELGSYVYYIEYHCSTGERVKDKGTITLLK